MTAFSVKQSSRIATARVDVSSGSVRDSVPTRGTYPGTADKRSSGRACIYANKGRAFTLYGVRVSGSVIDLETAFVGQSSFAGGVRGCIRGFSARSRRRLFKVMAAIPWAVLGPSYFVTLTYPADFPADGATVKRHIDNLRRAYLDRFGRRVVAVWKLEFQRRGAPHFHLAMRAPEGMDIHQYRAWLSERWYRIVGSGDPKHLLAGTQVQELAAHPAAYFAGYVGSSRGSKEYQHRVPPGFENVGRFWGKWGLDVEWRGVELSGDEYVTLRRLCRAWKKSQGGRRRRAYGRVQGEWWSVGERSAAVVLAQLSRALPRPLIV